MRKRNCRVEIYFTKDELESLTKKVRKSGLSRESFCRHLLNGAEIKEAPSADVPMLINEVRRVGYNIDQILRMANARTTRHSILRFSAVRLGNRYCFSPHCVCLQPWRTLSAKCFSENRISVIAYNLINTNLL